LKLAGGPQLKIQAELFFTGRIMNVFFLINKIVCHSLTDLKKSNSSIAQCFEAGLLF